MSATEVAANSIRHGGEHGVLRTWSESTDLCASSATRATSWTPWSAGEGRTPGRSGGRGMWLVHQLCDLVDPLRTGRGGQNPAPHRAAGVDPQSMSSGPDGVQGQAPSGRDGGWVAFGRPLPAAGMPSASCVGLPQDN
ncbi:hypothetical protein [Streptomyces sp. NPDC001221]